MDIPHAHSSRQRPPHATTRGSNPAPITARIDRETRYHRPREGPTGPICAARRLGVVVPTRTANNHFKACTEVTAPLVELICQRNPNYPEPSQIEQRKLKVAHRTRNRRATTKEAELLKPKLPRARQRAMEHASEKSASSWLTAIPMPKYGFNLHKQAFRDTLCLRFGWTPARLAIHGPCGQPFSVSHAFSFQKGAMQSIRHNAVRDITAQILTELCPNVGVEPTLQPLNGESFPFRSTNTEDGARLDIKSQNFWDKSKQPTFFDVRIFNSLATSNCTSSSDSCYRRHEREKRRAYKQHLIFLVFIGICNFIIFGINFVALKKSVRVFVRACVPACVCM